jgi:hypothetical protein
VDEREPWIKFYPDDWNSDIELASCRLSTQGFFIRLIGILHHSKPYGYLTSNSKKITSLQLSHILGIPQKTCNSCLKELTEKGVLKKDDHGYYSQRMRKDREKREAARRAGKKGGNPQLVNPPLKEGVNPTLKLYSESDINTEERNIYSIFEHWISKDNLIRHRSLEKKHESSIKAKLKIYSVEEIELSINNYSMILADPGCFMNYKWRIDEFMARGLEKFLPENDPFSSYKRRGEEEPAKEVPLDDHGDPMVELLGGETLPRREFEELVSAKELIHTSEGWKRKEAS